MNTKLEKVNKVLKILETKRIAIEAYCVDGRVEFDFKDNDIDSLTTNYIILNDLELEVYYTIKYYTVECPSNIVIKDNILEFLYECIKNTSNEVLVAMGIEYKDEF